LQNVLHLAGSVFHAAAQALSGVPPGFERSSRLLSNGAARPGQRALFCLGCRKEQPDAQAGEQSHSCQSERTLLGPLDLLVCCLARLHGRPTHLVFDPTHLVRNRFACCPDGRLGHACGLALDVLRRQFLTQRSKILRDDLARRRDLALTPFHAILRRLPFSFASCLA